MVDELGFVVDFGGLRDLKAQIDHLFDHTLLIDEDDPQREVFEKLGEASLAKVIFLPSASAEGIAKFVYRMAQKIITDLTNGRAWVCEVIAEEDEKNKAICEG